MSDTPLNLHGLLDRWSLLAPDECYEDGENGHLWHLYDPHASLESVLVDVRFREGEAMIRDHVARCIDFRNWGVEVDTHPDETGAVTIYEIVYKHGGLGGWDARSTLSFWEAGSATERLVAAYVNAISVVP